MTTEAKPFKISKNSMPVSSHTTLDEALDEIAFLILSSPGPYVLDTPLPFQTDTVEFEGHLLPVKADD